MSATTNNNYDANITIYTSRLCPSCVMAKDLFAKTNLQYREVLIDDPELRDEMIARSGGRVTVPQIFIGDRHIGGYDDLKALNDRGELLELVNEGKKNKNREV